MAWGGLVESPEASHYLRKLQPHGILPCFGELEGPAGGVARLKELFLGQSTYNSKV